MNYWDKVHLKLKKLKLPLLKKEKKEIPIKRIIDKQARLNILTKRKCAICPNFMQAKKHKYCSNKCARKAEKKLAKLRRLK